MSVIVIFLNILILSVFWINKRKTVIIGSISKKQFYQQLRVKFKRENSLVQYGFDLPNFEIKERDGTKFSRLDLCHKFVIIYFFDYQVNSRDKMVKLSHLRYITRTDIMVLVVGTMDKEIASEVENRANLQLRFLTDSKHKFRRLFNIEDNNNATIVISPEGKVIFSALRIVDYKILAKIIEETVL